MFQIITTFCISFIIVSGTDAFAQIFPVVAGTNSSSQNNTNGTSHIVALPSGIVNGDLLLVFWDDENNPSNFLSVPYGWVSLYDSVSNNERHAAFYKIANGSEGISDTFKTTAGDRSAHTSYRISAGTYQGIPKAGIVVTGNSSNPDPPEYVQPWGAYKTLWIAASHSEGVSSGTAPLNYTDLLVGYTGNTGVNHARMMTAQINLTTPSEDPEPFSISTSVNWAANTIGIQGADNDIPTLRLMPLGDSVTKALTGSPEGVGYRKLLYDSLSSSGYNIDFVGSQNQGNMTDADHEGHSGYTTWQINANVQGYLSAHPADIVLLHIGTNDVEDAYGTTDNYVSSVDSTLNKIDVIDTNITVFLAQIILDDNDNKGVNGPKATSTKDYNNKLEIMANNRVTAGDKIVVVNMEDKLIYPDSGVLLPSPGNVVPGTDIFFDNNDPDPPYGTLLHPWQTGYDKMANTWFAAIQNYFTPTPFSPANGSTDLATNINLIWNTPKGNNISTKYRLQVSTNSSFTSPEFDLPNLTDTTFMATDLNPGTTYYWRINSKNYNGTSYWSSTLSFTTAPRVLVSAKIFLQGPYAGGDTMFTTLNQSGYLPHHQPYNTAPWNYTGTDSVSSTFFSSNKIVDWVLLELRSDSTTKVASRAALLKYNGSLVDTDGSSAVTFSGVSPGNYYIVIKHRNHLAVMSSVVDSLNSSSATEYNFTSDSSKFFGAQLGSKKLESGVWGMIGGDGNANGSITASDNNAIWLPQFLAGVDGYKSADYNLNGSVTASDNNSIWLVNNGKDSQVP